MKIRILHVIETLGPGGVEKRRLLLAKYLDSATFEQKIICTQTRGPLADVIRDQGTEVIPIGKFQSILQTERYRQILSIIREYRPHVIHGAVFEGVTLATISGLLGRVPIIIAEETSDPQNRRWRGNLLLRMLTSMADYVVAISPSVMEYLTTLGIPARKRRLINNGVSNPAFSSDQELEVLKRTLDINSNDFVVGSVGRLQNFHKRFSDLILAVALLQDSIPQLKLLIVGDGPDREMLEQLAKDNGVSRQVIFSGYQYNVSPYYQCMDVFALASHMEGFGLVLAEAMFYKLPVVASNVGGMRNIVLPDKTGFLVPRHSPESFATAIKKLYENPMLREQMGDAGYNRALDEYSPEAYVGKVARLYYEAIEKKGIKV